MDGRGVLQLMVIFNMLQSACGCEDGEQTLTKYVFDED